MDADVVFYCHLHGTAILLTLAWHSTMFSNLLLAKLDSAAPITSAQAVINSIYIYLRLIP
jgi:hypothetical protein